MLFIPDQSFIQYRGGRKYTNVGEEATSFEGGLNCIVLYVLSGHNI